LRSGRRIDNYELYRNDIALELDDYFKKPYPEIVNWREERRIFEYIRESILAGRVQQFINFSSIILNVVA
jgi:hypothetical protein